jgi:hypothetical protein
MYPISARLKLGLRGVSGRPTYIVALDTQEITPLGFVIVAEDSKHDCEVPSIHFVLLAV